MIQGNERWPAVRATIRFYLGQAADAVDRKDLFCHDLSQLFDRLQSASEGLNEVEKARCGLDGLAVEVVLQIDPEKREILLDKLFKYCDLDFHLFTELLQILKRHYPDCRLVVPSLQGYELAREIHRFLGAPVQESRLSQGGGRGAAAHERDSGWPQLPENSRGHREALSGEGRDGEEEGGAGAGPGAVHVPAGRGGRGGGTVDAGGDWIGE